MATVAQTPSNLINGAILAPSYQAVKKIYQKTPPDGYTTVAGQFTIVRHEKLEKPTVNVSQEADGTLIPQYYLNDQLINELIEELNNISGIDEMGLLYDSAFKIIFYRLHYMFYLKCLKEPHPFPSLGPIEREYTQYTNALGENQRGLFMLYLLEYSIYKDQYKKYTDANFSMHDTLWRTYYEGVRLKLDAR